MRDARAGLVVIALALPVTLLACGEAPPPRPAAPSDPRLAALGEASRHEDAARQALAAGQADLALPPAAWAVEIRRRNLGPAHPDTWRALELLAAVHAKRQQPDLARQTLLEAISGREAALGPRHPSLAAPLDELARLHADGGQTTREEELRRRALSIRAAALGPQHHDLVVPLIELGVLLRAACRLPEAAPVLLQAWNIASRALHPPPPELARILEEIAEVRWQSRDDLGAKQQIQRAIALLDVNPAADPVRLVRLLLRLAAMEEDLSLKRSLDERALTVAERHTSADQTTLESAGLALSETLRALGNEAGAATLERHFRVFVRALPAKPAAPASSAVVATTEDTTPRCARKPASGGSVSNASSVVATMAAGFRRCYNKGLREDSNMKGSVRVTATIGPGGEVVRASAPTDGGLSQTVVACVVERVFTSTFAPPEGGGATVVIPVTFVSQ